MKCFIEVATENQTWIDCEKEIEVIVTMFLKILYDRNVFTSDIYYIERSKSSLCSYEFDRLKLMNKFCKKPDSKILTLHDKYVKNYQGIDKKLIMDTLKRDLNDLIKLFKFYLEKNVVNQSVKKFSAQINDINPDYVINFNYTNTYKKYSIERQNVCYIHGSVQDDNMVLGIRDIDEKDINSIYFKKFFQRIQKHTDVIQWDRFIIDHGLGSKFNIANTYFFGHSLSNTDGDLINNIYKNSCKIIIFHLDNQNDYEQKIINLIDTLGKEVVIQGMYSGNIKFVPIK